MTAAPFDRRLTLARPDLAADHLRGLVDAPRYAIGQAKRVIAASAPLRRYPAQARPGDRSAPRRERHGLRRDGGWAWVQLDRDSTSAICRRAALAGPFEPTHRVVAFARMPIAAPASRRRRGWRCRSARGSRSRVGTAISQSRRTGSRLGRHLVESGCANRITSPSPSAFSKRLISGAAGRRRGSTARASSRRRSPPPASPRRATATCRRPAGRTHRH